MSRSRTVTAIFASEKLGPVLDLLEAHHGRPQREPGGNPLDQLIVTILSQNTSDVNCERAYSSLRARFPNWTDVIGAPTEDVAAAIRCGGLAQQKAPRIQQILQTLAQQEGELSLQFLGDMETHEAEEWLQRLPGVGPKTASIVMLFSFGRACFPVDTHVERVGKRIGLAAASTPPGKMQRILEQMTPEDRCMAGHLLLVQHGRKLCHARGPECALCPIVGLCAYAQAGDRRSSENLPSEPDKRLKKLHKETQRD